MTIFQNQCHHFSIYKVASGPSLGWYRSLATRSLSGLNPFQSVVLDLTSYSEYKAASDSNQHYHRYSYSFTYLRGYLLISTLGLHRLHCIVPLLQCRPRRHPTSISLAIPYLQFTC
jgi:hypothetical protein